MMSVALSAGRSARGPLRPFKGVLALPGRSECEINGAFGTSGSRVRRSYAWPVR
jgi:hypothetical protein